MAKEKTIDIPHPRANPVLFGHAAAQARFLHEFERGLVHHAYLMVGHKGIGKATLAYRFARFLLANGAQKAAEAPSFSLFGDAPAAPISSNPLELPETDPMFRRIAAGSHTDLLTISPAYDAKKHVEKSSIGVDEARRVPEFLSLTPAESDWRVVIVDAVDQLNVNAANALLKILEEPPARAILLLVCHSPGGILPTIRSRCRTFKLTAPDATEFAQVLSHIAPHIPNHEYAALYALSYGAPGRAITLHQEDAVACYQGWINAMQPSASHASRQLFADAQAARKTPEGWATVLHCWNLAMQRLSLHPFGDLSAPIMRGEAEKITAIAEATSPNRRAEWLAAGQSLIRTTETFNLDKRYTLRALCDVAQLDMMEV